MARESIETIQDKINSRAWDQSARENQRLKLRQYLNGESLGADIPLSVKQRMERNRVFKRALLILVLIGFIIIAG